MELIEVAHRLGGPAHRSPGLSGQRYPNLDRRQGLEWVVECINQVLPSAREHDIVLGLENHYKDGAWDYPEFAQKSDLFLELLDRLPDRPHFGVQYDPSNAIVAGDDPIALLSPRRNPTRVTPSRSAASIARSDGADTAQRIGTPATAAFWTISKLTLPLTIRIRPWSGIALREDLRADELVERVVPADVLAQGEQLAARREEARGVEAAGLVERPLGGAEEVRQGQDHVASHDRPVGDRLGPDGNLVERRLAANPARRRRDEMALGDP